MLNQEQYQRTSSQIKMRMLRCNVANRANQPIVANHSKLPPEAAHALMKFFLNTKDSFQVVGPKPNTMQEQKTAVREKMLGFLARIRRFLK